MTQRILFFFLTILLTFSSEARAESKLCSILDFNNFQWPSHWTKDEKSAFQLAMSLTGTFEGHHDWQNLSTDFDGQGLSMGLLSQNLGTGTLQPLFIFMEVHHPETLKKAFSVPRLESIQEMLRLWEVLKDDPGPEAHSPLDSEWNQVSARSRNTPSVEWARTELYRDKNEFHPEWKKDLQTLLGSRPYVHNQIQAGMTLHKKARSLQQLLNVHELRAYLLAFDLVVQNGGLYDEDRRDYKGFLLEQPLATNEEKLKKILALRLRHVKPAYVEDVRQRKTAIINGRGKVHGRERDFEREFCFDRKLIFPISKEPRADKLCHTVSEEV